jgi:glutamate 5-kinase
MRIVVKVGTQIIANAKGLDQKKIASLVKEISSVIKAGHEVVLVSSGAVGAGLPKLDKKKFGDLSPNAHKKVAAAIGQPMLMHDYIREAKKQKIRVAQVLILRDDFTNEEHFKSFVINIENMLHHSVLPIINENDVMKREDLLIGDNDGLSAMVAAGLKADKLIILTNQDGLFTANPDLDKKAELVKTVDKVDSKIEKYCSTEGSTLGRGGMITKVNAAKYATERNVATFICRGDKKGIIAAAVDDKKFHGTKFLARK